MRLLKTRESGLSVKCFSDGADIPKYAILSHTWYKDEEEITFEQLALPASSLGNRKGWHKIQGSKKAAVDDGLEYIWIDTICIDKSSSTELAEAINSMFRYYRDAQVCYVYLNDMPDPVRLARSSLETGQHSWIIANDFDSALRQAEGSALQSTDGNSWNRYTFYRDRQRQLQGEYLAESDSADLGALELDVGRMETSPPSHSADADAAAILFERGGHTYAVDLGAFRLCRWFTRGWTLQELLAPGNVCIFTTSWQVIPVDRLSDEICTITKIHPAAVRKERPLASFSVAQRMSWAANRVTRRPEDRASSLMGLFNVNITVLYGEGMRAFGRLQSEILRESSSDQSIFAFTQASPEQYHDGRKMGGIDLLATSPDQFSGSSDIVPIPNAKNSELRFSDQDVTFVALLQADEGQSRPDR